LNIFVGNLNFRTTDEDLQSHFEQFGEVSSAKIITDRNTHRSRGFGFVEMADDSEGEKAISELNGKDFNGRDLTVNKANERK